RVSASWGANTVANTIVGLGDVAVTGISAPRTCSVLRWEVGGVLDFGINIAAVGNRCSLDAFYYIVDTEGCMMSFSVPMANVTISRNSGSIRNSGVEIALNWSDAISPDFTYTIGANFTTVKNETLSVENESGYIDAGSAEFRQRTIEGEPLYAFYGYETTGVY